MDAVITFWSMRGVAMVAARWIAMWAVALAVLLAETPIARAQGMEIVFRDGLYGAAVGALIGTAQVLLIDEPEEELHRIPTAAAIGAILGVAFGILEVSGAFASYDAEQHRLVIGLPLPRWDLGPQGQRVRVDLFEASF